MNLTGGMDAFFARARKRRVVSLIVVLAVVLGVGAAGGFTTHFFTPSSAHAAVKAVAPARPTYPKAWDKRILPLVKIVQKDRGLKFLHPVYVDFLSSDQFARRFNEANSHDLTAADRNDLHHVQDTLRALAITADQEDLLKDASTSSGADVIGFYSYVDKRIWVRDTRLTAAVKETLVHELTHALDDQHFDLDRGFARAIAGGGDNTFPYTALVEGDAVRIEAEYLATLSKATRALIGRQEQAELKTSAPAGRAPWFLSAESAAAYPLGVLAVSRVARKGGNPAVDRLFEHPPVHSVQFIEPWLFDSPFHAKKVTTTAVPAGDQTVARGEFGALNLYLLLLLSQGSSPVAPLEAADAWGGDQYVTYIDGGSACVHLTLTGRTPSATRTLQSVVTKWAQSSGFATVTKGRTTVTTSSCSSGASYLIDPIAGGVAIQLLTIRNQVEADLEKKATKPYAICYSTALPEHISPQALIADQPTASQKQELEQIARSCLS